MVHMHIDTYERIAADAASMSVEGASSIGISTVYGLGSTSGHALMRMGELAVRGVDSLNTRRRLQRITSIIRSQDPTTWPLSCVSDVLEFQRQVYGQSSLLRTMC